MRTDTYKIKPNSGFVIAPLFGCNLISWTVEGKPVFYYPDSFSREPGNFFKAGNPILFPSVGRTWDLSGGEPIPEQYRIFGDSRVYRMPTHGVLPSGHFQRRRERVSGDRVEVEYLFTLRQAIQESHYPFDVRFMQRYVLKACSVKMEAILENHGQSVAPFAFGYHPYFNLESRQGVEVHLPCREQLRLDPKLLIPTGSETFSGGVLTLAEDVSYDNVFGGLTGQRASIVDKKGGRTIHIDFDSNVENLVVYSPVGSKYVCLEPWTKGLGGFGSLAEDGWQKGDRINVLKPGETRTIEVSYTVE
jgi:galactose mutarotase-like enzyme